MKSFSCSCGNILHFENIRCLQCGREVGFLPDRMTLVPIEPSGETWLAQADARSVQYRKCRNYSEMHVCNWMVPASDPDPYCRSCRLNRTIPNLSPTNNPVLWYRIETAKRRCLYTLLGLGLPIIDAREDESLGLSFEFLEDTGIDLEFSDPTANSHKVMTGHHHGNITINIAEADPSAREQMREQMQELYRTLLGHFRHEIGHYYWMILIENTKWKMEARTLFGEETIDYAQALQRYYQQGPQPDWDHEFISAYASSHPWEDWAETWAHYMHILDTLETAHDVGFYVDGHRISRPEDSTVLQQAGQPGGDRKKDFNEVLNDWIPVTVALNELNRSMGLPDAYPFILGKKVTEKLQFIHRVVLDATGA